MMIVIAYHLHIILMDIYIQGLAIISNSHNIVDELVPRLISQLEVIT